MIITIDGPTASGKSTVARELAHRIGFSYLSSGLLYRGIAYYLKTVCGYSDLKMRAPDPVDLRMCVENTDVISYASDPHGEHLFIRAIDVTAQLKTPEIDQYASIIAAQDYVQDALADMQRMLAYNTNAVVEGRNCGTAVFPDADVKFYLTASVMERAQRFAQDQKKKGISFTEEQAIEHIQTRDRRDSTRESAPLMIPEDAIIIDNSTLTIEQTVEKMLHYVKNKPDHENKKSGN